MEQPLAWRLRPAGSTAPVQYVYQPSLRAGPNSSYQFAWLLLKNPNFRQLSILLAPEPNYFTLLQLQIMEAMFSADEMVLPFGYQYFAQLKTINMAQYKIQAAAPQDDIYALPLYLSGAEKIYALYVSPDGNIFYRLDVSRFGAQRQAQE
jgi:hypothetical protein